MRKIRTAEPFPAQHSVLDNSQHYRRYPEFGFSANRRRPKRVLDRLPGWRRDGYTNTDEYRSGDECSGRNRAEFAAMARARTGGIRIGQFRRCRDGPTVKDRLPRSAICTGSSRFDAVAIAIIAPVHGDDDGNWNDLDQHGTCPDRSLQSGTTSRRTVVGKLIFASVCRSFRFDSVCRGVNRTEETDPTADPAAVHRGRYWIAVPMQVKSALSASH